MSINYLTGMIMKKQLLMMSLFFALAVFCACSDDAMSELMESKLSLFKDSLQSVPENDYTGVLYYDSNYRWTIIPPGTFYDGPGIYHIPLNLPDDFKANKEESKKVSYSGKVIKLSDEEIESLNLWRHDEGKESFYFVYLTNIEEIEIPYRGNPPFTITDLPGVVFVDRDTQEWYVLYSLPSFDSYVNAYYPTELPEEFKVSWGLDVKISGEVYEEYTDRDRSGSGIKAYKINLTKIEKAE